MKPIPIAVLKRRLQVGVKLRVVERATGPCDDARTVARVQTNAIALATEDHRNAWIWWTRGVRAVETPDGFRLSWPNGNFLRFAWAGDAKGAAA